jgi:hypothetical protein
VGYIRDDGGRGSKRLGGRGELSARDLRLAAQQKPVVRNAIDKPGHGPKPPKPRNIPGGTPTTTTKPKKP